VIGEIQVERPILVVDDNNSTRYSTVRILRAAGVEVLEAVTGEQGIALAAGCDAVVLDVNLPDLDGFEVCRRLREGAVNTRVPVIHLTAQRMRDEDKIRGLESGADAYLTHPVDPGVLVATINALRRARMAEYSEQLSRARYEAMFRTAPVGIAMVAADGSLIESNAELHRMFGVEPRTPADHATLAALVTELMRQCPGESLRSTPVLESPGRPDRPLHFDCRLAALDDGARLVLVVDVTHRRELEEAQERLLKSEREARHQAEEASRAKDQFLALLSHELRNPLAPISSAATLLQMAPQDALMVDRAGAVIARQVGHMKELVDDLMDVSRVTRGLVELECVPLELQGVIDAAVEQVRPLIEAREHTLQLAVPDAPVIVEGDRTRLVQVIANLLNNAAKYTPPGGRITASLDARPTDVTVAVEDSGVGIAPELLPHVFELFTQAERTPDRAQGGLGVGLALVRSLVALHGGRVEAASAGEGQGSTFTVHLPLSACSVGETDSAASSDAGRLPQRVLLVDDNVDAAATLADVLRLAGHRVHVAHDAGTALDAAQTPQAAFDVFVLDIGLPGMTGHELVEALKAMPRWQAASFVALTGYGQPSDREDSREAGFDAHLVKPVQEATLLDAIDTLALALARARR
jgi:signal transduction histidine kinase